MRIVQVTHEYNPLQPGGAQQACWNLFEALNTFEDHQATMVSIQTRVWTQDPVYPVRQVPSGFVVNSGTREFVNLNLSPHAWEYWVSLLGSLQPDVLHLHHLLGLGGDVLTALRQFFPKTVIALTLHEYLLVCARDGQMKRADGSLCAGADPFRCAECLSRPLNQVILRSEMSRAWLEHFDLIISPSRFLVNRFEESGVPLKDVVILPNAVREPRVHVETIGESTAVNRSATRFTFLGSVTPNKGMEVLIQALEIMKEMGTNEALEVRMFASGIREWLAANKDYAHLLQDRTLPILTFEGYDQGQLDHILSETDYLVVPSTWWENSPLVISEARRRGCRCIVARGSACEEAAPLNEGHARFNLNDALSLAQTMTDCCRSLDAGNYDAPKYPSSEEVAVWHLQAYRDAAQKRM